MQPMAFTIPTFKAAGRIKVHMMGPARIEDANLDWNQDDWDGLALRTLSYEPNRMARTSVVADSMIEEDAHQVPNLRERPRQRQRPEAKFDLSSVNAR
jgi:hypothetical protein